jgi:hypothetical protein
MLIPIVSQHNKQSAVAGKISKYPRSQNWHRCAALRCTIGHAYDPM